MMLLQRCSNKIKVPVIFLLVLVTGLGLGASAALANMSGFRVSSVAPNPVIAGTTFDFTFNVQFSNIDDEWLYRFEAALPANWTINSVRNTPANTLYAPSTQGYTGKVVYWTSAPWSGGSWQPQAALYQFRVNVTVDSCTGAPWSIPWTAAGEVWAAPPHTVRGTIEVNCATAAGAIAQPPGQTTTVTPAARTPVTPARPGSTVIEQSPSSSLLP